MLTYDRNDLILFLRAVDVRLTRPGTIRLIGGAVISLAYVPSYQTRDVDYAWADREVDAAVHALASERRDLVSAALVGVYSAPYTYEDRLEVLRVPGLVYLQVEMPERHDLAVMKIARGYDRDIAALAGMHHGEAFDLETLVERWEETWVTGEQRTADTVFYQALVVLFGEEDARGGRELLADRRKKKGPRGRDRRRRRR